MTLPALSLRNKLLCFAAALIVIPGLALGLIAQQSGSDSLQRVIGHQLARESHHAAEQLSSVLAAERDTLRSFARLDLMREIKLDDIDKRVSLALVALRDGSRAQAESMIVGSTGRAVAASNPVWLHELPAWATPERLAGERIVGPFLVEGDRSVLLLTTPVPDPDQPSARLGTLVGVYAFDALLEPLRALRNDLAAREIDTEVLVAKRDGAVLGVIQGPTSFWSIAGEGAVEALGSLSGGDDYRVDEADGLILGWASLGAGLPDWNVIVVESLADALAPARRLSRQLTVTMGFALGIALLIAALAARRVTEPLRELAQAIRELPRERGSALRVPVRSQDEVGELGATFNRMATELEEAQRELVEAEKFAFVGELASGVAHEIRTSLGVLRSSAQILERSLPADTKAESVELANLMTEEVGRLSGVVDDLLTLDRRRALELEPTLVSEPVLRAASFALARAKEEGIEIVQIPCEHEVPVLCDEEVIYQACVNLIVNAIGASSEGGRIEVEILPARGGFGGFAVSDDGPGVPDAIREEIFKPFVTQTHGGVGLGLTFVKRVVHEHRGRVTLEKGPLAGASFRVELPLVGGSR